MLALKLNKVHKFNLLALIAIIPIIIICYFFIDRPLTELTYYNTANSHFSFIYLFISNLAKYYFFSSPIVLTIIFIRNCLGYKTTKLTWFMIAMCFAILFTFPFNDELKFIFGRTWPGTWSNNNPSWIQDHVFGFNFFTIKSNAYMSFPSGHSATSMIVSTFIWHTYRNIPARIFALMAILLQVIGLLLLSHHWLSDTIAGMYLGMVVGNYFSYFFQEIMNFRSRHIDHDSQFENVE
tara:strand:- start:7302 stop:8012 length:711 start_codon:yes stop_codon:yes gene_type:complete